MHKIKRTNACAIAINLDITAQIGIIKVQVLD